MEKSEGRKEERNRMEDEWINAGEHRPLINSVVKDFKDTIEVYIKLSVLSVKEINTRTVKGGGRIV